MSAFWMFVAIVVIIAVLVLLDDTEIDDPR